MTLINRSPQILSFCPHPFCPNSISLGHPEFCETSPRGCCAQSPWARRPRRQAFRQRDAPIDATEDYPRAGAVGVAVADFRRARFALSEVASRASRPLRLRRWRGDFIVP